MPSRSRSDPFPRSSPLVLLDTNALFLPGRVRFPLEAEVHRHCPGALLAVPSSVLGELERLEQRGEVDAKASRAFAQRFPALTSRGRGDDAVLELAQRRRAWVVTSDRALRERLRAVGLTVLFPRDRHRLEVFPGLPPSKAAGAPPDPRAARRAPSARGNG